MKLDTFFNRNKSRLSNEKITLGNDAEPVRRRLPAGAIGFTV